MADDSGNWYYIDCCGNLITGITVNTQVCYNPNFANAGIFPIYSACTVTCITPTPSPSAVTPTPTPSITKTATPTVTPTPSDTPDASATPTPTVTPTPTSSEIPVTPTPTETLTPTPTSTPTYFSYTFSSGATFGVACGLPPVLSIYSSSNTLTVGDTLWYDNGLSVPASAAFYSSGGNYYQMGGIGGNTIVAGPVVCV